MKKTWANATVEELDITMTAGGSKVRTEHDQVYGQTPDGIQYEEYAKDLSQGK